MSHVLTWPAVRGHYSIDVVIGGIPVSAMVDTGLIDSMRQVGFELPPDLFDRLVQSNSLQEITSRTRRDASGRKTQMYVGQAEVRLTSPGTTIPVGAAVQVSVARSFAGLPARVGLEFFHRLSGCQVLWNCVAQMWTVSLP